MKPAIVTCSALLGLFVLTGMPSVGAQTPPVAPQGQSTQAPAASSRLRAPPPPRAGERRRPTYASCNRAALQRSLRGGARRRFLIRCKLGYERPRTPQPGQPQPAPARQP